MAPFDLAPHAGSLGYFAIFLLLGVGFGAVLEMSGFGDSRRLAAQFYLRDMTVLKVMFTGIIVASVLVHLAAALEVLDLERTWINPTYLVPGIVGGLIMGVGFIVGGFCPGTSLVAASTLKLDGVLFVLGGLVGALAFGETVHSFDGWWHSTSYGRLTVYGGLGVGAGVVVVALVVMALGVFVLAEVGERVFGRNRPGEPADPADTVALSYGAPSLTGRRAALFAAGLVGLAGAAAAIGQPTVADRWRWKEPKLGPALAERAVQIHPAELVELRRDLALSVRVLEVRDEADFNRFHLSGSRRLSLADTEDPGVVRQLLSASDRTVWVVVGNGEGVATEAWKRLVAQGLVNAYILDGGIGGWLAAYPLDPCIAEAEAGAPTGAGGDALPLRFAVAVGDRAPSAHPDVPRHDPRIDCGEEAAADGGTAVVPASLSWFDGTNARHFDYVKKVKIQKKVAPKGGCG